jgi:hypothetical protein
MARRGADRVTFRSTRSRGGLAKCCRSLTLNDSSTAMEAIDPTVLSESS